MVDATGIKQLIECLTEQAKLIAKLVSVGEGQIDALKVDNISLIKATITEQEKLGRQLALREKARREIVFEIGRQFGSEFKLVDILQKVSSDEKQQLQRLSDNIVQNQLKLHAINELTRLLLKQSLQYVHRMLSHINPQIQQTYGVSGKVEQVYDTVVLNRSV